MIILKEEINELGARILSLAKWKLIAVASFVVAGLGWSDFVPEQKTGTEGQTGLLLLYCVGYLCAYVDNLFYRHATVIHIIAKYLRTYSGNDPETLELRSYERAVNNERKRYQIFIPDYWPQFVASLTFTVGAPILGHLRYPTEAFRWSMGLIPIIAIGINLALFWAFTRNRRKLTETE